MTISKSLTHTERCSEAWSSLLFSVKFSNGGCSSAPRPMSLQAGKHLTSTSTLLTVLSELSLNQAQVMYRPTISRLVCPRNRPPSRPIFLPLHGDIFGRLCLFCYGTPSLTRRPVCNLLTPVLLGLARAVTLGSKSHSTWDHILLPYLKLGFLSVASSHSQGSYGSILPPSIPGNQAKVVLRPTVSRPVCTRMRGPWPNFSFSLMKMLFALSFTFLWGALSDERTGL
jgi:hypothetical protein